MLFKRRPKENVASEEYETEYYKLKAVIGQLDNKANGLTYRLEKLQKKTDLLRKVCSMIYEKTLCLKLYRDLIGSDLQSLILPKYFRIRCVNIVLHLREMLGMSV